MPKNFKKNKSKRRPQRKAASGISEPARVITRWPVAKNPVVCINRSLRRRFVIDATTIDALGASTMQITFAPGQTDWRLGGASIYVDPLQNSTEFSTLFDQWRLKAVSIRVDMPLMYDNSGGLPIVYPNLNYIVDYDSYNDCTLNQMVQYPQMRVHNFQEGGYKPLMITLSPKPLRDIASSGVSTGYGPLPTAPWIRTDEFGIPHYGLKLAWDFMSVAQTADLPVVFTVLYSLEFTNPK